MALRTDDVQSSRGAYRVGFRADLVLIFVVVFLISRARVVDLLIVGVGKAGRLCDQLVVHAVLAHRGFCHVFGVTAQDDICTAPCHVGCDGDSAQFTRLRDDLRFLFVVLRVEYVMLDARALEHLREHL